MQQELATEDVLLKRCSKCGNRKPLDDFERQKKSKDGRHSHCKACRKSYFRNYYLGIRKGNKPKTSCSCDSANPGTSCARGRKKSCSKCGEEKCRKCFYSNHRHSDGLMSACKKCTNAVRNETRRNRVRQYPAICYSCGFKKTDCRKVDWSPELVCGDCDHAWKDNRIY